MHIPSPVNGKQGGKRILLDDVIQKDGLVYQYKKCATTGQQLNTTSNTMVHLRLTTSGICFLMYSIDFDQYQLVANGYK